MSLLLKNQEASVPKLSNTEVAERKRKYFQEYREKRRTELNLKDRTKYYKKKFDLDGTFCEQFGEYSGDVAKIEQIVGSIQKTAPELIPHIIARLREK